MVHTFTSPSAGSSTTDLTDRSRPAITPFEKKLGSPLTKNAISVLQVNLGRRCNLACTHCHVEAGPHRTEELSHEVCEQLLAVIRRFDQIKTVDLTGGAPEMNYGFRPLVEAARASGKEVIVRSNLTIFFEPGYEDLPEYFAQHQLHVVASLPCYLSDNVDAMRGKGVYDDSVRAIQKLNALGYGKDPNLLLDLVYNPPIPTSTDFSLTPGQAGLQADYSAYLKEHFGIVFNHLFTITNLPIGRTKFHLQHRHLHQPYLKFLESHHNASTVEHLMCRNELSIDYSGNIYDCDFNQMEGVPARSPDGTALTVEKLLAADSLDVIEQIATRPYCYGCTAGSGSSCGGALL
ncbi:arsenosugar biosynthesis radical SAM (seleno)protein ArsS [Leptolyngbya sp. BC1307]|uniref:arsenosugar biosynthesis radical SAM (seleno)protein ArsS n=1 Tax=Leptolyngbya sp. BC1307 TaxID=2029589 RepID=UPI000EFD0E74|nr:arsenosugar biosynthesis radical SAM (seleno)protein ArsS [Leptolyngbya sp. BC1307]